MRPDVVSCGSHSTRWLKRHRLASRAGVSCVSTHVRTRPRKCEETATLDPCTSAEHLLVAVTCCKSVCARCAYLMRCHFEFTAYWCLRDCLHAAHNVAAKSANAAKCFTGCTRPTLFSHNGFHASENTPRYLYIEISCFPLYWWYFSNLKINACVENICQMGLKGIWVCLTQPVFLKTHTFQPSRESERQKYSEDGGREMWKRKCMGVILTSVYTVVVRETSVKGPIDASYQ